MKVVPLLTLACGRVRFENKTEGEWIWLKQTQNNFYFDLLIDSSVVQRYKLLLLLYMSYLTLCLIGIQFAALMLIDIWWCLLILPPFSRFLYIHTFLTYNESKFDSNVPKLSKNILRYSGQARWGDISHSLQRMFCQEFIFISWANVFPLFIASNILRNIFWSWRFSSQLVSQSILAHWVSILFFVHHSDF